LSHDARGCAGFTGDGDVQCDSPLAFGACELDPSKLDVAMLAQCFHVTIAWSAMGANRSLRISADVFFSSREGG
jgi:hypothetical protein